MKKSLFIISIVSLLLTTPASLAAFKDISATDPDISAFNFVQSQGIMTGSEDGDFHPELSLSRCELVKVALVALDAQLDTDASATFPDIASTNWCNQYAKTARASGIITGYPDGRFRPNQKVTQIEALKILINAAQVTLPIVSRQKFTDVKVSDWWAPYIQYSQDVLYSENPIYLRRSPSYGIQSEMTRAEAAYLIWKLFAVSNNQPTDNRPQIRGDADCVSKTQQALDLLRTQSPSHLLFVTEYIGIIECVPTGSGMYAEESPPRYQAGEATINAGGIWYAGSMVHDACHSQQYQTYIQAHPASIVPRDVYFGRAAEVECNTIQIAALRNLGASEETIQYVENSTQNAYWDSTDRNW